MSALVAKLMIKLLQRWFALELRPLPVTVTLDELCDRLINGVLVTFSSLGTLALIASLLRAVDIGWKPIMSLHVLVIGVLWLVTIQRNRCSFKSRLYALTILFWTIAIGGLLSFGLASIGLLPLVLASIYVTIFRGIRAGVFVGLISTAIAGIVGIAATSGHLTFATDLNRYCVAGTTWLAACISVLLFSGSALTCLGLMRMTLLRLVESLSNRTAELEKANANLCAEIAERKQAEEKFAKVFRLSLVPLIVTRLADGRILDANKAFFAMTGYEPHESLGKTTEELGLWRSAGERLALIRSLENKCSAITHEMNFQARGGAILSVQALLDTIEFDGERCLLTSLVDLTERKRAEAQIIQAKDDWERTFNAVPDLIALLDTEHRIVRVNKAMADSLHLTPDACVGQQCHQLVHGSDQPSPFCPHTQALADRKEHEVEITDSRLGKRVQIRTAPLTGANGQFAGSVHIARDVTEHRRLEDQLRQAQKMDAFGQLAGGVAHDFNNILTGIFLNLGALQDEPTLSEETKQGLKELENEAQMGASLTRQLLLFSRRQSANPKSLDLYQVISDMAAMLRRLIGEQIDFVLQSPSTRLWVNADLSMMQQVVMNLCINARDAMKTGGRITLSAERIEVDARAARANPEARIGSHARLSVRDNGCGMSAETMKRLFEPFFTTKEVGKGTGLGLATVFGIVKQHQGWLEVESVLGSGSTFHVHLPLLREATEESAPATTSIPAGNEVILLVEDDCTVRRLVAMALRTLGYAVMEAVDGSDAMKVWEGHGSRIDMLFTDMVMPGGLSGYELARRLRIRKPELKVIISSGYPLANLKPAHVAMLGFVSLTKPYDSFTLARVVRACLDGAPR